MKRPVLTPRRSATSGLSTRSAGLPPPLDEEVGSIQRGGGVAALIGGLPRLLDINEACTQQLAAASDVSRHKQPDPPPGSAVAAARPSRASAGSFERLYSHQTHASRAKAALTQSQAADGAQRVVPGTAMKSSDAECTFAPKLATDYTPSSQVRAVPLCLDRRSVGWSL